MQRKGFTFIEVVLTMIAIAFVLLLVIPLSWGAVKQSRAAKIASELRRIGLAAETYVRERKDLEITMEKLANFGYLRDKPENYDILVANNDSFCIVEVVYGDPIDYNDVKKILPGVEPSGNSVKLVLKIEKIN